MNAAVFLDRDNTLIHNDGDLGDPALVRLVQGASSAVASLCGLGYKVIVVTNQGGVARGHYTEDDVRAVHDHLRTLIEQGANGAHIHGFYYCPYHPQGTVMDYRREHPTRKPQPGMLLQAAADMKLDLKQSWTIGDQLRDVEAGAAAGTRTVLIQWPGKPAAAVDEATVKPDFVVGSLIEAVRIVAQARKPEVHQHTRSGEVPRRWDAAAVAHLQKPAPDAAKRDTANDANDTQTGDDAPPPQTDGGAARSEATATVVQVKPARRAPRPFRPMELPAAEDEPDAAARQPAWSRPALAEATQPTQATEPARAQDESPPAAQAPAAPVVDDAAGSDASAPLDPLPPSTPTADATLRQILHELRNQRGEHRDFSYVQVLGIVLQMLAGVCLLGALWMGAGDTDLFQRWMGTGLLLQGATIALLLYANLGR